MRDFLKLQFALHRSITNMTIRQIAKETGINLSALYHWHSGSGNLSPDRREQLWNYLNQYINELSNYKVWSDSGPHPCHQIEAETEAHFPAEPS